VKKQRNLSSRDLKLLSAYLDGELTTKEQKRAEKLLRDITNASSILEDLQMVKGIFRLLPSRPVPRNFLISEPESRKSSIPGISTAMRYASAVSTALLAIMLAFDFLIPNPFTENFLGTAQYAPDSVVEEKSTIGELDYAPLITELPEMPSADEEIAVEGKGGGPAEFEIQEGAPEQEGLITPAEEQAEELPMKAQVEDIIESDEATIVEEDLSDADEDLAKREAIIPDEEEALAGETDRRTVALNEKTIRTTEYLLAACSILTAAVAFITRKVQK
jgi:hypothetical protein